MLDAMTLIVRCLQCGEVIQCTDDHCQTIPEKCPSCGAPKEELAAVEED